MTASITERFDHVVTAEETGVYEHGVLKLTDEFRAAMKPVTFTLCEIAGRRSNGLVWVRFPSKEIIATASGVGTAKPPTHRSTDGSDAPYVVAMTRAEEQLVNAVRDWK
jgi:hypothetical protein